MTRRRSRLEMLIAYLQAIESYPHYAMTRLSAVANVNPKDLKQITVDLNDRGFIKKIPHTRKGSHRLNLTKKGQDWLRRAERLLREVGYDNE